MKNEVKLRHMNSFVERLGFTNFEFDVQGDELKIEMTFQDDSDYRLENTFDYSKQSQKYQMPALEFDNPWEIENAITDSVQDLIEMYENGQIDKIAN
jgi:hypothetical protein